MDSPFYFDDAPLLASPVASAELRAGIQTKAELFDEVARGLHFPEYFGANWDAFEECIRDLSWLPAGAVVLRHTDLPLAHDQAETKTYLSILSYAVQKSAITRERDLIVVFPSSMKEAVNSLYRMAKRNA